MRKTKADLVRGWQEKARRDLLTAEKELASAQPFADIVCFHAQQALEIAKQVGSLVLQKLPDEGEGGERKP